MPNATVRANARSMSSQTAKKRPISLKKLAALNFEPWKHKDGEWTPPSLEEWSKDGAALNWSVVLAWHTMFKTKAALETSLRNSAMTVLGRWSRESSTPRNSFGTSTSFSKQPNCA
jgi:hypothetical protein